MGAQRCQILFAFGDFHFVLLNQIWLYILTLLLLFARYWFLSTPAASVVAQFFTPIQNFLLKLSNKLDYFGNILNDFFLQKYKNDSSLLRMDLNAANRNMQCKRILKIFFGAEEEKKMMLKKQPPGARANTFATRR